jgi:hypothetical protein
MQRSNLQLIGKMIAFQLVFLILHYSYQWFPNVLTRLFSATDESVYQHMKVAFFAYIPIILGEYGLRRKSLPSPSAFDYARVFSLVILPLVMMVYFLFSPAFFVKIESIPLEIVFANLALLATSGSVFLIEDHFERAAPGRALKIILIILFLLTLSEFLIFTGRLPWFDIFANPPGW